MRFWKKASIFIAFSLVICALFSLAVFAADASENGGQLEMSLKPESFGERLEYAVQGTVTGILMVFSVLALLCIILYGSKLVFYDIPNRKKNGNKIAPVSSAPAEKVETEAPVAVSAPETNDDGALIAVITAAIAAAIEGSEYKDEFAGGFRVVSFKRSSKGSWNRK